MTDGFFNSLPQLWLKLKATGLSLKSQGPTGQTRQVQLECTHSPHRTPTFPFPFIAISAAALLRHLSAGSLSGLGDGVEKKDCQQAGPSSQGVGRIPEESRFLEYGWEHGGR